MSYNKFQFEFSDLKVDFSRIEKVLGYGEGDDREIVNSVIAGLPGEPGVFRNIRAEYRIFTDIEFISSDKSLSLGSINFRINKVLFRHLAKADSVAVFLSTAGEGIVNRSRRAMAEGDPLTGYIYDMVGSMVADAAADLMQHELEKTVLEEGKKITNRYSPGYCGWDVSEQHKLFSLLPGNFCGIRLTDSALMDPVKSISGFIGIGRNVKYHTHVCTLCNMKDCAYREVPGEMAETSRI
jgi:hypothetical protein